MSQQVEIEGMWGIMSGRLAQVSLPRALKCDCTIPFQGWKSRGAANSSSTLLRSRTALSMASLFLSSFAFAANPSIVITSPGPSQLINIKPETAPSVGVIVRLSALKSNEGIIQMFEGDSPIPGASAPFSSRNSQVAITWLTRTGSHTVTAKASNAAGDLAASGPVTFVLNQLPHVQVTGLARPNHRNDQAKDDPPAGRHVRILAYDRDGSVAQIKLFSGNTVIGTGVPVRMTNGGASNYWTVDWPNAKAGTYQLYARATDDRGAVSQSSVSTVKVGGEAEAVLAPKIFGEVPRDVRTSSHTPRIFARLLAEESGIDIVKIRMLVDGRDVTAQAKRTEQLVYWQPTTELGEGLHRIHLEAVDKAGRSASKDWQFMVEAKPAIGVLPAGVAPGSRIIR